MDFRVATNFYLPLFYLFGLSPYHPDSNVVPRCIRLCSYVMIVAQTIIAFAIAIPCIIELLLLRNYAEHGRTDIILINSVLLCQCARSLFTLIQCCYHQAYITQVNVTMQQIDLFFDEYFYHRISYKKFRRKYARIVILMLYFYIQYVIIFCIRNVVSPRLTALNAQIKLLQGISVLTFLHIIFYVELMSFHMDQLMAMMQGGMPGTNVIVVEANPTHWNHKLILFKQIYFQIWKINEKLNEYFGWCLVAMLLENFVALSYAFYWFLGHFVRDGPLIKAMRK